MARNSPSWEKLRSLMIWLGKEFRSLKERGAILYALADCYCSDRKPVIRIVEVDD